MIDKKDIVLIGNTRGWYSKCEMESGYVLVDPYINHGLLFRVLREAFFRLKLPGKSLFYNRKAICTNKILVVGEGLITYEYLNWLHKKCPTCRIILKYDNPVKSDYSPNGFPDEWCEKWTADNNDAINYGMNLYSGGGYFRQWKLNKTEPQYDVFYVGKDKGRLEQLNQLEAEFKSHDLKTLFYITWEHSWQKKDDGIHKQFLPYDEVLKYIGKSKAILHLIDGAQKGVTIRIQESLIHKVKLITDDIDIIDYDFYHPNNIFILGKDNMDDLKAFLDLPYVEMESQFYKHAYYDQMIEEITGKVNNP